MPLTMLELPNAPAAGTADAASDLIKGIEPLRTLLAEELERVAAIFERQLVSDLSAINALCVHIEAYRGKMLRPTLVLLSGLAAGDMSKRRNAEAANDGGEATPGDFDVTTLRQNGMLTDRHRIAAAVVEMIHMATLVHDDVLDEADVRRGGATVNHLWGNEAAVMLGDYLISNAFHLCSTMGDPQINLRLGEITNTLCEGELIQLHHRNDYGIDEAMYFEIVTRKTASLIGECCRLGAVLSDADEKVAEAMKDFGLALGIAFQIQDDLLDLIGEQSVVGKSLGKDIAKGKLTLPITHLMASVEVHERSDILRMMEQRESNALREQLLHRGSVEYSRRVARQYVHAAKREIAILPAGPARDLLNILADTVIARSH